MRRKLAAGNWKMNGSQAALAELEALAPNVTATGTEVVLCPPATLLSRATDLAGPIGIGIGAQDCHAATHGAHTGDVSAPMIAEAGATHVILGHSERRADHSESDADVRAKAEAAWAAGLVAILCIGESAAEREANKTLDVVSTQLAQSVPDGATARNLVVAYEPIWAIGTGAVASLAQIIEVHDFMRDELTKRFGVDADGMRLLYGGSVKPANAAEIFTAQNVDGALVGGASLKAADFGPIIAALAAS